MSPPITSTAPRNALINPAANAPLISAGDNWLTLSTTAPAIMGAESKNEIRALTPRESPKNKAAVIVIPLRDTPGINASACAQPIKKTVWKGTSNKSIFSFLEEFA